MLSAGSTTNSETASCRIHPCGESSLWAELDIYWRWHLPSRPSLYQKPPPFRVWVRTRKKQSNGCRNIAVVMYNCLVHRHTRFMFTCYPRLIWVGWNTPFSKNWEQKVDHSLSEEVFIKILVNFLIIIIRVRAVLSPNTTLFHMRR